MGAQQRTSIPEPLQDWAGVSLDGTVQNGRAASDDSLRRVSFALQHRRLCRDNPRLHDQDSCSVPANAVVGVTSHADEGQRSDGAHAVLGHAHVCTSVAGRRVVNDQRAPASLVDSGAWNQ